MQELNKVMIIGNLGKDPELRHTPAGKAVCAFSVATNMTWIKDGEKQQRTEWHRCVAFEGRAETISKYLRQGSKAFFEGRLQTRTYTIEGEEKPRHVTEIVIDNMQFLDSRNGESGSSAVSAATPANQAAKSANNFDDFDDDIPF